MLGIDYNTALVLIGTATLGAAAGVVGALGLLRGRALLGDALAHATLPGICIAFLLFGRSFPILLAGALATGLLGVLTVAFLRARTPVREDAAIGIVLSVFFGFGLALSDHIQKNTPDGSQAGVTGFILGRTAGMIGTDVAVIAGCSVAVLIAVAILFKEFKLLCFDPEFAAVDGWPIARLDVGLMLLLAVTTVVGLPAVGVVLMVALLILPAAAARFWVSGLSAMLLLASCFGVATGVLGTILSASASDLPAGPLIVLAGSAIFLFSSLAAPQRGILARILDERQRRQQRVLQGLLSTLHDDGPEDSPRTATELIHQRDWSVRETRKILRECAAEGWVERDREGWRLTDSGRVRAARVVRTHRLWEHYLLTDANIDRDLIDPDAEVIEKILPKDVIARLESELIEAGRLPKESA